MYFVTFTTAHILSIPIHNQSSSSGHPIRSPTGMPGRRFIRGRIGTHHGGWTRPPQRCSDHRGVVREGASILGAPRVWMMLGQKSGGPARAHTHTRTRTCIYYLLLYFFIYVFIYLFIYLSTYLFIYLIYSYIIYSFSVLFMRLFIYVYFVYLFILIFMFVYYIYTTYHIWHTMYPIISYPISYHMHIYTYNVIIT